MQKKNKTQTSNTTATIAANIITIVLRPLYNVHCVQDSLG